MSELRTAQMANVSAWGRRFGLTQDEIASCQANYGMARDRETTEWFYGSALRGPIAHVTMGVLRRDGRVCNHTLMKGFAFAAGDILARAVRDGETFNIHVVLAEFMERYLGTLYEAHREEIAGHSQYLADLVADAIAVRNREKSSPGGLANVILNKVR